ncbi:tRNA (guanosine(37)-N1)-methyltransferase TrmD [Candidatus Phycosocius spiralis]|nr:tRNA (guanosine(37)-N1)-methyltransferase TrmD [Candidatus Phycosocius spiralis]
MPFAVSIITLTPAAWPGALGVSLVGGGLASGVWTLDVVDLRRFGIGKHQQVDDTPAGGGAGMVIKPDVAARALDDVPADKRPLIYLTPRGKPLAQKRVRELSQGPGMVLFCGRFEGLDERVITERALEEISVGDIILTGGDLPAQMLVEACVRLLPSLVGNEASLGEESFEAGLLEHPLYTRPREFEGQAIPEVLLSGDHAKIAAWKKSQSLATTQARRPDLWAVYKGDKD